MKKGVLFLALLVMASIGGCNRGEDLSDTITRGTWRVSYYIESGDEDTSLFRDYVFTFRTDGTVAVVRPGEADADGVWNEENSDTRFELDFGDPGLLERLEENWVVDWVHDDELLLHESGSPFNQLEFARIF